MLWYQQDNSSRINHFRHLLFTDVDMLSHFHGCFEIVYALQGDTGVVLEGESFCLREGEMCLFLPNQVHSFRVKKDNLAWVCVFSEDLVERFRQETEGKAYVRPIFTPPAEMLSMLPVEDEKQFPDAFALRAFLYLGCHAFYQQAGASETVKKADADAAHAILTYIAQHYSEEITLGRLAREFGMNRQYISSVVRDTTRQNFRAYLNGYRLEKAKGMLAGGDTPVSVIACECGFGSIRTFNRAFSQSEGVSPTRYREKIRGKA